MSKKQSAIILKEGFNVDYCPWDDTLSIMDKDNTQGIYIEGKYLTNFLKLMKTLKRKSSTTKK